MSFRLADVPRERIYSRMDIIYKKIETVDNAAFVVRQLTGE